MIKTVYSAYCQKEIQIDYSTLMDRFAREVITPYFLDNEDHLDAVETYLNAYLEKLCPKAFPSWKILSREQFDAVINELASLYPNYLRRFKRNYVGSLIELIDLYPQAKIYVPNPTCLNDEWYYDDRTHCIKVYDELEPNYN